MLAARMVRGRDVVRMMRAFLVMLGLGLVLSGCAGGSRGGPVPYDRADFNAPDVIAAATTGSERRLGPGDVVNVSVFQVPELSGDREIDSFGRINMPLIGAVNVAGLTVADAGQAVSSALNVNYMRNANVQVLLKAERAQVVTVDGAVMQPGIYPMPAPTLTLQQTVAMARGTSELANLRRVIVFRTIDNQKMAAAFDLRDIRDSLTPDPLIYPNDIVVVDGSGSRQMFRDFIMTVPLIAVFRPFG